MKPRLKRNSCKGNTSTSVQWGSPPLTSEKQVVVQVAGTEKGKEVRTEDKAKGIKKGRCQVDQEGTQTLGEALIKPLFYFLTVHHVTKLMRAQPG